MSDIKTIKIDGIEVVIEDEKNILELVRKAGINLPTFCYQKELSVYGSCRMCVVEVEGRGIQPACSTPAEANLVVRTNTEKLRKIRKMTVELMLASHEHKCTTCPKSGDCKLQTVAKQMGVDKIRFKQAADDMEKDFSSYSVVRDPNKCVLCGNCVRTCSEIQGVGVFDFTNRSSNAKVLTAFNKPMADVECVNCGQCVKVCPVGALTVKYNIEDAWAALHNPKKTVVVQIAPAVRVALGEYFGLQPGTETEGKIVTALKMMGANQVFDTSFSADLTVIEEGNEFLKRFADKRALPQFTSCCPGWVKFAEEFYPELLPNLSSCKSPQQMFGSVAKEVLPKLLNVPKEDLVVVSVMPCTAKKFEANRPEMAADGMKDVDVVITTKELALMIKESGIEFNLLKPAEFDKPLGEKTGAGVIFGASGGVAEAVLRYAAHTLGAKDLNANSVRGLDGIKITEIKLGAATLRLAVVSGLANARKLLAQIKSGETKVDLIEVMACCGGCVNGGGQPETENTPNVLAERSKGLYANDKSLQTHSAEKNTEVQKLYAKDGALADAHKTHELLHTKYQKRPLLKKD